MIRNLRFCPGGARVVGLSPVWWGAVNFERGACVRELTEDSNLCLCVHIAYCVYCELRIAHLWADWRFKCMSSHMCIALCLLNMIRLRQIQNIHATFSLNIWWLGWGYKTKSWPIDSALANFTAFGYTFAIKIVSDPKKKFSSPWVCTWKKWLVLMGKWGKNIKKTQNGQKSLFEVLFWFLRCVFGGFRG